MKTRDFGSDLIRVISVIMVIMVHTSDHPWRNNIFLSCLMWTVLCACNSFFLLLSGKYNLRCNFNSITDYKKYYINKLFGVIIPYVIVSIILSIWNMNHRSDLFSFGSLLRCTFGDLMSGNSNTHLWFMYILIGFLLSAPFWAKMLQSMNKEELILLSCMGLIWNFITIYCFADTGHSFAYSGWILSGWVFYFLLGYILDCVIDVRNERIILMLGIVGFFINVFFTVIMGDAYSEPHGANVGFMFFCISAYLLLQKIQIKNKWVVKVVSFISKHSFVLYMIHLNVDFYMVPESFNWFLRVGLTFVVSLGFAVVFDLTYGFLKSRLVMKSNKEQVM